MKRNRGLIAVIFAALILAGIYYYDSQKTKTNDSNSSGTEIRLLDVSAEEISEVGIDNRSEKLVFSKDMDKWRLTYPSGIKYDQVITEGLHLSLGYIAANKEVARNKTDLSPYGLDKPVSISVKSRDGKVKILEIGSITSSKEDYYARVVGNDRIYTVPAQKAEAILLTKSRVKDKNVLALAEYKKVASRGDDIRSIILKRHGEKVFEAGRDSDGSWNEMFPKERAIDASKLDSVLNAIARVTALEFVDEAPELSKYGLDKPSYGIEFEYALDNKVLRKKLYIGDENKPDSEFFARVEGSKDVFILDETGFDFLDRNWNDS